MNIKYLLILALFIGVGACTDLEEELREDISAEEFKELQDVPGQLLSAYRGLRLPFQDQSRFWAAQQHTSDETLGPTRGPDWDDNGVWRVLHDHTWSADHSFLSDTYNDLLSVVFTTTNLLQFSPTPQQEAEARYLRAFVMFSIADGWNQVPFRQPGDNLLEAPTVVQGPEALQFVIDECNAIMNDLPDGPTHVANKDAAKVLLMKAHLNKGTFADRSNPSFDAADMNQVIAQADALIGSGKYSLEDGIKYYDNFAPNNDQISTENIWTGENEGGTSSGNVRSRWFCTLHYHQNPSGWNGFTTLGSFYDSFEEGDIRRGDVYPAMTDVAGIHAGLLLGQQYDGDGNALQDRKGNPLSFTKEVSPIEAGDNLEITGVRVIKYPIDYNSGDNVDNDYVFYRYADVLLMKAEAQLRSGNEGDALSIVNEIRAKRGASNLANLDATILLAERGRELYWEGHRRQDQIRFGTFLNAFEGKPASGPERLLFPIPANALAVNPNLVQNPGY